MFHDNLTEIEDLTVVGIKISQGCDLSCFDIFQCNLVQDYEVEEALQGADCVYHMASYGMSGREQVRYSFFDHNILPCSSMNIHCP